MKVLKSNSYKQLKTAGAIDQISKLVRRGLSVETAAEQVYGVGRLSRKQIEEIKRDLKQEPVGRPIRSI